MAATKFAEVCRFLATLSSSPIATRESIQKAVQDQVAHVVSFIASSPINLVDATNMLERVNDLDLPFGEGDRVAITSAINDRLSVAFAKPSKVAPKLSKEFVSRQTQIYMWNYLSESDWQMLVSEQASLDDRFLVVVNRSLHIGLLYPSEPSYVALLSLISVAAKEVWDPETTNGNLQDFKSLFKVHRNAKVAVGGAWKGPKKYPCKAADLLLGSGIDYGSEPPIASPVSVSMIEQRRLSTAARSTHRSVRRGPRPCKRESSPMVGKEAQLVDALVVALRGKSPSPSYSQQSSPPSSKKQRVENRTAILQSPIKSERMVILQSPIKPERPTETLSFDDHSPTLEDEPIVKDEQQSCEMETAIVAGGSGGSSMSASAIVGPSGSIASAIGETSAIVGLGGSSISASAIVGCSGSRASASAGGEIVSSTIGVGNRSREQGKPPVDVRAMLQEWDGLMKERGEYRAQQKEQAEEEGGTPLRKKPAAAKRHSRRGLRAKAERLQSKRRRRSKGPDAIAKPMVATTSSTIDPSHPAPVAKSTIGTTESPIGESAIALEEPPAMPPLKACVPIDYRGCRIYTSVGMSCWRVYPHPGACVYDRKFKWTKRPLEAWQRVIDYCKNPVLPASRRLA